MAPAPWLGSGGMRWSPILHASPLVLGAAGAGGTCKPSLVSQQLQISSCFGGDGMFIINLCLGRFGGGGGLWERWQSLCVVTVSGYWQERVR